MSNGNGTHSQRSAEELASALDPEDGFHIVDLGAGDVYELALVFREGGELVSFPGANANHYPILRINTPNYHEQGEVRRMFHLLTALCRYINTGGSTDKLYSTCGSMGIAMGRVHLDLDGFFLLTSDINTDGVFEHVFLREDSASAIRVVEGQFVDLIPIEEIDL